MTKNKTTKQGTASPKPRNKTINLKEIQRREKKLDKMSTYVLDTDYDKNENTIIKYYEEFSHDRIEALLEEAYSAINEAEEEGIPFFKGENQDSDFLGFVNFLIAVRFTSLDKMVPKKFSESYPLMISMHRQGLTNRIHDEVLDQEEVAKVYDKIEQLTLIVDKITRLEKTTREELVNTVQNKEILNYMDPEVVHPLIDPYKKDSK